MNIKKNIYSTTLILFLLFTTNTSYAQTATELTLKESLKKAIKFNTEIKSAQLELDSKQALIKQAKVLPNTELEIESENLGSGSNSIVLAQLIELGGKRTTRISLSQKEKETAILNFRLKEQEIISKTNLAFLEVLKTQVQLELMNKAMILADSTYSTVKSRILAGATMSVEETRAKVAISLLRIEKKKMQYILKAKKNALASIWCGRGNKIDKALGNFTFNISIPELTELNNSLAKSPNLLQWNIELEKRKLEIKATNSEKTPNITIAGGYSYNTESKENSTSLSFSMPLPIFNRNRGNIIDSKLQLEITEQNKTSSKIYFETKLSNLYAIIKGSEFEVKELQNITIPSAEKAFTEINRLYKLGKIAYLDLLDAQSNLIEMQFVLIDAKVLLLQKKVEIEEIINLPLETIQ